MAFALGEHRDQHIGAGHLLAARGLDMDRGALQDALEARRRLGVLDMGRDQIAELVVDVMTDVAAQLLEIDGAGAQHRDRVLILGQRQQQVLERGIFVPPFVGISEGAVQGLFEVARQHERPIPYIGSDGLFRARFVPCVMVLFLLILLKRTL